MSWSPAWEPSVLSSSRRSSIFDRSLPRHGSIPDGRIAELNKFSLNIDQFDRQLSGTTFLPPIYGPVGLGRSLHHGLPAMIPSVLGSGFPSSPARKSSLSDYLNPSSLARPTFFSPMDTSYYPSPAVAPPAPLLHHQRPFEPIPFSSPGSPLLPSYLNSASLTSLPKRSKAALAAQDWDHPSFARPPHRAFETQSKDGNDHWRPTHQPDSHHAPQPTPSAMNVIQNEEPLVPNLYPVPPPPPYEQSAAPLSDLAADMVWERCYMPKPRALASPIMSLTPRSWESSFSWSAPHSFHSIAAHPLGPLTNPTCNWAGHANTYGVIGAEAKARRINRQYSSSLSPPHPVTSNGSSHSRKLSTGPKIEVKPAFRRWTHQVLEQTLLSPQVLILALYYIDCVASSDVFGDDSSKSSLLPYKMLLSALVVANKTLDDHSYRNSTFANVSSMTNAEVNAIEVALLSSLNFNVVPTTEQWTHWLKEFVSAGERLGFYDPDLALHSPLSRLVGCQHVCHQPEMSPHHYDGGGVSQSSIFDQVPTPDYTWHPTVESLGLHDHRKAFSSAPNHELGNLDLRNYHTPVSYQSSKDYGITPTPSDFAPSGGHYFKRLVPRYS